MADFSEVVLQVNLAFVYSDSATSGDKTCAGILARAIRGTPACFVASGR